MTTWVGSTSTAGVSVGWSIRASSRWVARLPRSRNGWLTVVSGGSMTRLACTSSNPVEAKPLALVLLRQVPGQGRHPGGAALDVNLVSAAFQADQPDDVLSPPGQAARRRVGDEAERLDHGEHALPRIRMHQVRPPQYPRHSGGRHPGYPGDVIDHGHADRVNMIKPALLCNRLHKLLPGDSRF
jgi:hypothetical protein